MKIETLLEWSKVEIHRRNQGNLRRSIRKIDYTNTGQKAVITAKAKLYLSKCTWFKS